MAIKAISQCDAATPTSNDKILFEQNGDGKSTTIGNAVNTCSLTYEEIQATTDLTGKVAGASAVKYLKDLKASGYSGYLLSGQSVTVYRKLYSIPVAAYLFVNFGDAPNEFALYYISPSPNAHLILGTKNENVRVNVTYDTISVTNNLLWSASVYIIGEIEGVA